jgi:hypothetical protein
MSIRDIGFPHYLDTQAYLNPGLLAAVQAAFATGTSCRPHELEGLIHADYLKTIARLHAQWLKPVIEWALPRGRKRAAKVVNGVIDYRDRNVNESWEIL